MSVPAGASVPHRSIWWGLGAVVLVGGVSVSVLGARVVAGHDAQQSVQAQAPVSLAIASTLQLALQHEQDLDVGAVGFMAGTPGASATQFRQWVASVRAFERYPELVGIAEVSLIPAAGLPAFAARDAADPPGPLSAGDTLSVIPAGVRPFYCLETGSVTRPGSPIGPAGFDYCASTLGPALLTARDTGQDAYLPYYSGTTRNLAIGSAIYSGGAQPATVAARRAAFIGWTGSQISPRVLLDEALVGHPKTAIGFRFGTGPGAATFSAGHAPAGSRTSTVDLHNGWYVLTSSQITSGSVLDNDNAVIVLLGGLTISLLMALLILTLGTGRARAMWLMRKRTAQLEFQAFHDSLTGLPNRALILDRLEQMMLRLRRERAPVSALFLDLDNFKDVNDTLGHAAGDQLLVLVANRLTSILREGDTVGRFGGDEFVILVDGESLSAGPELVAQRILDVMMPPFELASGDTPVTISVSIGIAEGLRAKPEDLLRDADIALRRAKAAGKRHSVVFASPMQDAVDARRTLERDLRTAVSGRQFFVVYQPTVDIGTGIITGVEALLRWRHPQRGVVGPVNFVPALESTGLIVPVGRWVLDEACRQGAAWMQAGHHLSISVNISANQLDGGHLVDDVRASLESSGFRADLLILELTETILMRDVRATVDQLHRLKATGIRISIDDFGTGYSSLAYLRKFPIDILKIDQSFVAAIADTRESAAIVHTLVQLGKVLGLETVAEGIETIDQWSRLRAEDVDRGQGYLFARPLDVPALDHMLSAESERSVTPVP